MITQFFPGRFFSSKDLCSAFNNFLDVEEYRALKAVLSQKHCVLVVDFAISFGAKSLGCSILASDSMNEVPYLRVMISKTNRKSY